MDPYEYVLPIKTELTSTVYPYAGPLEAYVRAVWPNVATAFVAAGVKEVTVLADNNVHHRCAVVVPAAVVAVLGSTDDLDRAVWIDAPLLVLPTTPDDLDGFDMFAGVRHVRSAGIAVGDEIEIAAAVLHHPNRVENPRAGVKLKVVECKNDKTYVFEDPAGVRWTFHKWELVTKSGWRSVPKS